MKLKPLKTALSSALGISVLAVSSVASAGVLTADWTGYFILLDDAGYPVGNYTLSSKTANQYVTPISGTLTYNDVTGIGSATVAPFNFYTASSSTPLTVTDFSLQAIGDGMGGSGNLILGNMLFDWNGSNGNPVSLVWDASGLFDADPFQAGNVISGVGAMPAVDGTYIGSVLNNSQGWVDASGYLDMGPMPLATTAWNTSFGSGCSVGVDFNLTNNNGGGCMGITPSGVLPLVLDSAENINYDNSPNIGGSGSWSDYGVYYNGIGGSPIADGPWQGTSANFNIATLVVTGYEVPVPAAAWLFGSGLLGLIGVTRRCRG